ncbi:hypothetical protein [Streptomyces hoynatensis]|uniref:hypothetical protein n=1 Tax=Streptomyces hoynatensis TaxID=1141874 RepID=UPI0011C40C54|nr:hypothetical protein [Streptomyces hoynatensis]
MLTPPAGAGAPARRTADVLRLVREEGRVRSSARVPPGACPGAARLGAALEEAVARHLPALLAGLAERGRPEAVCQSVHLTVLGRAADGAGGVDGGAGGVVGLSVRALARAETAAGPVLLGARGAEPAPVLARLLDGAAELAGHLARREEPPHGWRRRPLLLRPPVAAALAAGARLALEAPAARGLDGRRGLPPLSLAELPPDVHREAAVDDAGAGLARHLWIDRGRFALPAREPAGGLPVGRAVWDHDLAALARPAPLRLRLESPQVAAPEEAVELVRCLEGLRRYHPGGRMSLRCLARAAPGHGWFAVRLGGTPLGLLRAVAGGAGALTDTCADQDVRSASLLLPAAEELERSSRASISAL